VEKEVGDEGQVGGITQGIAGKRGEEIGRDEAPGVDEPRQGRIAEEKLLEKEVEVGDDEEDGDDRPGAGRNVVAQRKQVRASFPGNI